MRPALAMIEPDIAGNVGTVLRTAACFDCVAHIVEPCGFPFSDRALRRAGMDYATRTQIVRHATVAAFLDAMAQQGRRIILCTSRGATPHAQFRYSANDVITLGSESAGAPDIVHDAADARVVIPMAPGCRSLNVAAAGAIIIAEALRQTGEWTP